MKASVVKIGNSRGIRIPKPIFEQCGFKEEVELEVEDQQLVIRAPNKTRNDWGEAFRTMAKRQDDVIKTDYEALPNNWDEANWEWK